MTIRPHDPEDRFLPLSAAAAQIGIGKEALRKWVSQGHIPGFRTPTGEIRIRQADILAALRPVPTAATIEDLPVVADAPVDPSTLKAQADWQAEQDAQMAAQMAAARQAAAEARAVLGDDDDDEPYRPTIIHPGLVPDLEPSPFEVQASEGTAARYAAEVEAAEAWAAEQTQGLLDRENAETQALLDQIPDEPESHNPRSDARDGDLTEPTPNPGLGSTATVHGEQNPIHATQEPLPTPNPATQETTHDTLATIEPLDPETMAARTAERTRQVGAPVVNPNSAAALQARA